MSDVIPDVLTMMVALGCDVAQAQAEYAAVEAFLILRETPVETGIGIVQADKVNVRAKPGLSAPVIGQVTKGAELRVWGGTPARDWLCVLTEPPGWIAADYLQV